MGGLLGAFWGTRPLQAFARNNSPGFWKRMKLTSTRRNNAKKRLRRVWQNEAVLKACAESQQEATASTAATAGSK